MLDVAMIEMAAKIVRNLPVDKGVVTRADRQDSTGETQRVWAVEYPGQTILLEFVFDDTEENERSYAEFLATGSVLLRSIAEKYRDAEINLDDALLAFQVTFKIMMEQYRNAKERIIDNITEDVQQEQPTVGET